MSETASNQDGNSPDPRDQPGAASSARSGARSQQSETRANLQKVLSHKAIQIGQESGITAEFIVEQTGEQLVRKLDDLFSMFDTFQEALYSNDPAINQRGGSQMSEN